LDTVEAINLFCLVIDPSDFGQSVENLYHLLFLVRDETCSFQVAENGEPLVCQWRFPSCYPPLKSFNPGPNLVLTEGHPDGVKQNQMVMEFNMATWRPSNVFDIHHPFIPHRTTRFPGS
ncbi:hypothetical protein F4604DRAFT_1583444, partial [Suillus subluteus]